MWWWIVILVITSVIIRFLITRNKSGFIMFRKMISWYRKQKKKRMILKSLFVFHKDITGLKKQRPLLSLMIYASDRLEAGTMEMRLLFFSSVFPETLIMTY